MLKWILLFSFSSFAQISFTTTTYSIDTTIYEHNDSARGIISIPAIDKLSSFGSSFASLNPYNVMYFGPYNGSLLDQNNKPLSGYRVKNTDQIDIFQISQGKIGSATVPRTINGKDFTLFFLTQYVFDNDPGWESIGETYNSSDGTSTYYLLDDNNSIVLTAKFPTLYYDADYTYLVDDIGDSRFAPRFIVYKFNHNTLIKPIAGSFSLQSMMPIMRFAPSGNLNINFQQTPEGAIKIRIFDMLGKLAYSESIKDINSPLTITIPKSSLPKSLFISNIKIGQNVLNSKLLPAN